MKGPETVINEKRPYIPLILLSGSRLRKLSCKTHATFHEKRKNDSESGANSPRRRIKRHGRIIPRSGNLVKEFLPSWISEQLWTSDSYILCILPFFEQEHVGILCRLHCCTLVVLRSVS